MQSVAASAHTAIASHVDVDRGCVNPVGIWILVVAFVAKGAVVEWLRASQGL